MKIFFTLLIFLGLNSCNNSDSSNETSDDNTTSSYSYLALGDSYTIGESVCPDCRFPAQLRDSLNHHLNTDVDLRIIATTGWRTDDLQNAITNTQLTGNYDLVTLLIGVNNQFQNHPFSQYETEFPQLLTTAIDQAGNDASNVIVVSIPDYAFTTFGQNLTSEQRQTISDELDQYNAFAKAHSESRNVKFLNITDITRQGFNDPELVASDGLHPSAKAYGMFVERLLPLAIPILTDN